MTRSTLLRRRRRYSAVWMPDEELLAQVAGMTQTPVERVKGYLVVGILKDRTIAVAHTSCCMPHVMEQVTRIMVGSEDLMAPKHANHRGPQW